MKEPARIIADTTTLWECTCCVLTQQLPSSPLDQVNEPILWTKRHLEIIDPSQKAWLNKSNTQITKYSQKKLEKLPYHRVFVIQSLLMVRECQAECLELAQVWYRLDPMMSQFHAAQLHAAPHSVKNTIVKTNASCCTHNDRHLFNYLQVFAAEWHRENAHLLELFVDDVPP